MADTENGATNPAQEIPDQTDTKVEDSNNNSEQVSQGPEDPASSENVDSIEGKTPEHKSAPEENNCNQGESEQKTDEPKEDGEREDSNQKEREKSEDSPGQDPLGKEEPKQDKQEQSGSNPPESNGETLTEQGGEETGVSKEETIKDPGESQNQDGASQEKVEETVAVQNSEPAEVDEASQKDGQRPVDTEVAEEAPGRSVVSIEVINENKEQGETDGANSDTQEQTEKVENSNEDENDDKRRYETVVDEGKSEDNYEEQAGDEEGKVTQDPEAEKSIVEDSSTSADTSSTPAKGPSGDAIDHAQDSATTKNDTDSYDGTDFEIKYRAAQKDVEKLRDLNTEMQQRLNDSENREQEQGGSESKNGMKVQAVYLASELSQQQDTEKYLREKLAEVLQEKEQSEQKAKDLEIRLKRFVKDDQAKDARIGKMEKQLRSLNQEFEELEKHIDEKTLEELKKRKTNREDNGEAATTVPRTNKPLAPAPVPKSKTCVIV